MIRYVFYVALALVSIGATANGATFVFDSDPFEGSDALITPGRQIVGGEPSINFLTATDVFAFDATIFGVSQLTFANDLTTNLPASGVNVIVVRDTGSPFLAGTAANLIAAQITDPGPGFFVYFNTNLDLARLVYSTDLSDNSADLAVLARMINISGAAGFDSLENFTADNFQVVPEPSPMFLTTAAGMLFAAGCALRRRRSNS